MSEVTYKKIVDVEQIDTLGEGTTLFVNDGGSMKQMGAAALGAVKSVNGVLPDENGEVYIGEQVAYLFADGTALVPDLYTWYGPGTLTDAVGRLGTTNKEITEIHRLIMTPSGAGRMYKSIGHEKIKNADSSYNARILFGDNICPVIFDTVNNKIITDPDWVKPEEKSVQPDWNQNDPNAPDYVKNRTHCVEITEAVTEVPDTAFTSTIDAGQGVAMLSVAPNVAAIGDKREIIYDGVSYVCEAAEFKYTPGVLYLGNASIMGAGDDSGEPFFWMLNSKTSTTFVNMDTVATAHTISCKTVRVETVHPIDPKFMPEDYINGLIDSNEKITALTEEIDELKENGGGGNFGVENADKLLYVGGDGNIAKVELGDGLQYENGVGKNIVHGTWEWGKLNKETGEWETDLPENMNVSINAKFSVTPGTTYTVSITKAPVASPAWFYVFQYDASGNFISALNYVANFASHTSKSFVLDANTAYISFFIYGGSNANVMDNVPEGFMIEKGSIATEYEPYGAARKLVAKRTEHVPDYYFDNNYIQGKASRIAELYDTCAGDGDAFFFFTDQHWPSNAQNSPALIRYVSENANVPRLFCGGDLNDAGIDEDCLATFAKEISIHTHHAVGNHEYAGATNGHMLCRVLDAGKENQIGNPLRHYYYVDNRQQKIRYIILNGYNIDAEGAVATGYESEQVTWLTNDALDLEADWTVVVFTHSLYWADNDDTTMNPSPTGASEIITALDAAVPDVACVFMGHLHLDRITHTPGGIPVVATTCDKYAPWIDSGTNMEPWMDSRVKGTITEQAIDAVVLDKAARKLTCVRIGAPADNWTDGVSTGTVEERVVTY